MCPTRYKPKAKSKLFKKFLRDTTEGDKDKARFLKKAFGYSLTGSAEEQILFYGHGPTKTGKSTLLNLMAGVMGGEYAINTPTKTFLVNHFDNEIPVDVARMKGARLVTAIESNAGKQLDEAKVKSLTGGDRQTARFMRQNPFDFTPECKIWIGSNDLPRVRATDDAVWGRFVLIPFLAQRKADERDLKLPIKLLEDAEAVLAWAVRGAVLWSKEGLKDKSMFDLAKSQWRSRADTVLRFVQECCQVAPPTETEGAAVLYGRYKQWCEAHSETYGSDKVFKARLLEMDYAQIKNRDGQFWKGIKIVK